jgi:hypothetical protein
MTLKIGYVGVGNWAKQLKNTFRSIGCECFGYVRVQDEGLEHFGIKYSSYQNLTNSCDLIVVAADPETTTEVALYCAENCIPCVATKPLLAHPQLIGAPFYVDFWRLYSKPYEVFKTQVVGPVYCEINFLGSGPFRESHDGLDDWGPHAFAFAQDLLGVRASVVTENYARKIPCSEGCIFEFGCKIGDIGVKVTTGNGGPSKQTIQKQIRIRDWYHTHILNETADGVIEYHQFGKEGEAVLRSNKKQALRSFAQDVVSKVRDWNDGAEDILACTNSNISKDASDLIRMTRLLAERDSTKN